MASIFGIYLGIGETVQRAIIPKYVPSEMRGTAYGLYYLVTGVTFFVANVVVGFLWDVYTLNIAVSYSLVLSVGAIISLVLSVGAIIRYVHIYKRIFEHKQQEVSQKQ